MINETTTVALCVLAIALVVWGASAFRSGSRVFCRIAPPVTLALFCCFVALACGVPTGLMHPCMAPAAAVLVGIAACVLVASAFAHIVHSRRVNPMAAATLGVAAALAGVEALSVVNVREAASSLAARVLGLLSFIGLWLSFAFVVFIVCSAAYRIAYSPRRIAHAEPFDFIVVHGAKIFGAEPSSLLASRVDAAYDLWRRQNECGVIVVSGGQGSDEVVTEADAMKRYLLRRGMSEAAIVEEGRSTTTLENVICSQAIMDERAGGKPYRVALVSSEFHVFRCAVLAQRVGLDFEVVAAPTRPVTLLRSLARECGGVLIEYPRHLVLLVLIWIVGTMLCGL